MKKVMIMMLFIASLMNAAEQKVWMHVGANPDAVIYLNDKKLVDNVYRDKATVVMTNLAPGDVIKVMFSHRYEITSFWMSVTIGKDTLFTSSTKGWYSYVPDDQNQWWILPKKKKRVKLVKDGSREYSQAIHRMAKNYGVKRTRSQVICPTIRRS